MNNAARLERETLAAAHELIAAFPGVDRARLASDPRVSGRAWWVVEQLVLRGLVVALKGDARGCCEVRFATARFAAKH